MPMGNVCCSKVSNSVETPEKKRKSYATQASIRSAAAKDPMIAGEMNSSERDGPDT